MNNIKNLLWLLFPIIASVVIHAIWLFVLGLIRKSLEFPVGDINPPSEQTITQLVIYNGIQLLFVLFLFYALVKLFKKSLHQIILNTQKHQKLWFSGILTGWIITCFVLFVESMFFCCPGFIPDLIQPWYWLTIPEFAILGLIGMGYLIKTYIQK